jgi:hypothetical protein
MNSTQSHKNRKSPLKKVLHNTKSQINSSLYNTTNEMKCTMPFKDIFLKINVINEHNIFYVRVNLNCIMSITAQQNRENFSTRRVIPVNDGFLFNHLAEQKFADIRRKDLLIITRRIEPRPLPARDSGRPYNTVVTPQLKYLSAREARYSQIFPTLDERPLDTRRDHFRTHENRESAMIQANILEAGLEHHNMLKASGVAKFE